MSYCPDCKQDIRIGGQAHTCPERREREANDRLALTTGSARVLPHELDLKAGEIMARCWKCFRLCAFTGCHTYTRHPHHGGATIIFQPDRYYAACPNCDAVQMQAIPPQNGKSPDAGATE